MSNRILLAEASDTIRGVATTVLRQNGFEVISVGTAQKAMEVLNHTRPNLLIVGGALADPGGTLFYERISNDHRFASTAMLLFYEPGQPQLPFPADVVINLPFDPKDFLERVTLFSGKAQKPPAPPPQSSSTSANPLEGSDLEDGDIDAALGLDRIEVTGSEVMDKTQVGQSGKRPVSEKTVGFDHADNTDTDLSDSSRIESIMISDESADIAPTPKGRPAPDASTSGKLDILGSSDQYGMVNPDVLSPDEADRAHDYEWFINEMQREARAPRSTEQSGPDSQQSAELTIADTASFVDPVTPPPASPPAASRRSSGENVERFIDEFKKEVEKIDDFAPESIVVEAEKSSASGSDRNWEDSLEKTSPESVDWFTREFVSVLAEKIATMIAAKIDGKKLTALLKAEIMAQTARKKQGQP
jgi:CheY-like chemotaxis protein